MPQPISNAVVPQKGLVSTNSFLNGPAPSTGGTTTPITTAPKATLGGFQAPIGTSTKLASGNVPVQPQTAAYNFNGTSYNVNGTPITSTPSISQAGNIPVSSSQFPGGNQNIQSQLNTDYSKLAGLVNQEVGSGQNNNSQGLIGLGNGGGQAPAGYSYNGQGQLIPTTSLGSALSTLSSTAGQSTPQYQAAEQQYDSANAQLQALKTSTANNNLLGAGTNASEYLGTQGLLATGLANQENALTGEMTAAQQAATTATNQQGTQQSGQGAVVNALNPQLQYGALVNPTTGTPISSSALASGGNSLPAAAQNALSALPQSAQSAIMLEAQKVSNNQETQAAAISNLSAYGQTGVTALNAILGSGFNANANAGASFAQQQNTATAGTASTQANASIYSTQLSNAAQTLQQAQAIQSSGSQLINTMTSLGINPTDPTIANKTINQLATQFSSPAYATFNANIANLQSKVSSLLSAGEIPTNATNAANQIINGSMSVSGLSAAINQINTEASQLAQSQLSTAQSAYQNLNNGSNGTTNTSAPSPYH